MVRDIMTVRGVVEYLELAEKTAYRHEADGKISGFKVGVAWRFRRNKIDRWIERHSAGKKERGGKWCRGRIPMFGVPADSPGRSRESLQGISDGTSGA